MSRKGEVDTTHELARKDRERVGMWRARQRLVGSYVLGGVAVWKIITYEPIQVVVDGVAVPVEGIEWTLLGWIGLALAAFGLATIDQILKAVGRK